MAKILINTTASIVSISDTGVSVPANPGTYTVPPQDYMLWAASGDVISAIAGGDIVVNDGSLDLNISDAIDLIKGFYPKKIGILSGNDFTEIGHIGDKLKVIDEESVAVLENIAISLGAVSTSIFKKNEVAVTSRVEFDLVNTTYTVPVGKKFIITSFASSYDAQSMLYVRLKKQTGGVGVFETMFRMTMMSGGQGDSTLSMNFGNGINLGSPGDIFKITIEGSIAKGTVWAEFSGSEV